MTVQALTVPPGGQLAWTFPLPPGLPPDAELRLHYRFSTSRPGLTPVRGTWRIGSSFRATVTNVPSIRHTVSLRASEAGAGQSLVVRYANDDPEPLTVVFPPGDGVTLHLRAGGFTANFARAVLMLLFRLALFCAIGLTAGTLFSTPVAVLMSLTAVLFVQTGGYVATLAGQDRLTPWSLTGEAAPGLGDAVLRALFQFLNLLLSPLQNGVPVDQAALGLVVEPAGVARAFLVQVLLYSGLLAVLSTAVFNRRELALPSS